MSNKWFVKSKTFGGENIREKKIFIFPYAGGSASSFKEWQNYLGDIDVLLAQYPGRENRINEKPIENFNIFIERIYTAFKEYISNETVYYLFGHSLGSKIVYELAVRIKEDNLKEPKGIIISAGKAPCFKETNPIHKLNDDGFISEISKFAGTPKEFIENLSIMKIFLPILRADFTLDETYQNNRKIKIDVPILGLMGSEDLELTLGELCKWGEYTNSTFKCKVIEGGHMFVKINMRAVTDEIINFLDETNG